MLATTRSYLEYQSSHTITSLLISSILLNVGYMTDASLLNCDKFFMVIINYPVKFIIWIHNKMLEKVLFGWIASGMLSDFDESLEYQYLCLDQIHNFMVTFRKYSTMILSIIKLCYLIRFISSKYITWCYLELGVTNSSHFR